MGIEGIKKKVDAAIEYDDIYDLRDIIYELIADIKSIKGSTMLLIDMEHKSELTVKASKDGIETVEEYNSWLMGYMTGYESGIEAMVERLKQDCKGEV